MAENIEFISAAELPEAEAEDIDILCVDNGELKKKSGANLGVRSWNQLEGRPFGEEEPTIIVPEITVTIEENTIIGDYTDAIKVGTTCIVSFNGTDYECVAYELEGAVAIGNGEVMGMGGGNGEPFLIGIFPEMGMGLYAAVEGATVSVKIPNIKPIDTKYLPEALQIGEEEAVPFEGDVAITTEGLYYLENPIQLSNQNTYIAFIDGVEYKSEYYWDDTGDGDTWLFSNEETDLQWGYYGGRNCFYFSDTIVKGVHHVKIVDLTNSVVKTFDKKFIPGLPYCVEVYNHGDNNYTCDLSYGDIEGILSTGTLVYAVIKSENNGEWYVDINAGQFFYNDHAMPDDDVLTFVRPDGRCILSFYGGGGIAYWMGQN